MQDKKVSEEASVDFGYCNFLQWKLESPSSLHSFNLQSNASQTSQGNYPAKWRQHWWALGRPPEEICQGKLRRQSQVFREPREKGINCYEDERRSLCKRRSHRFPRFAHGGDFGWVFMRILNRVLSGERKLAATFTRADRHQLYDCYSSNDRQSESVHIGISIPWKWRTRF